MISIRRILLGLFLGGLLVAGLTITFAADPATRTILRSEMPAMDAEPANMATPIYSHAWWAAQGDIDRYREKYSEAILVIIPGAIDKPVYVFGGEGAANSMIVTPMHRLPLYADAIRAGRAVWCPLREAFAALAGKSLPGNQDESPAIAETARLRAAIAQAIETLSSAAK